LKKIRLPAIAAGSCAIPDACQPIWFSVSILLASSANANGCVSAYHCRVGFTETVNKDYIVFSFLRQPFGRLCVRQVRGCREITVSPWRLGDFFRHSQLTRRDDFADTGAF